MCYDVLETSKSRQQALPQNHQFSHSHLEWAYQGESASMSTGQANRTAFARPHSISWQANLMLVGQVSWPNITHPFWYLLMPAKFAADPNLKALWLCMTLYKSKAIDIHSYATKYPINIPLISYCVSVGPFKRPCLRSSIAVHPMLESRRAMPPPSLPRLPVDARQEHCNFGIMPPPWSAILAILPI